MGKGKDGCDKSARRYDAGEMNPARGSFSEADSILREVQIRARRARRRATGQQTPYERVVDDLAVLNREQERRLALIAKQHENPEERNKARQALVLCNQRWVIKIAQLPQWRGRGVSEEELIQAGNQGLLTAVDKFEVERGNSFLTHAKWWVRQAMQRLTEHESAVLFGSRVPTDVYMEVGRVRKALAAWGEAEDATPQQLSELTDLPLAKVERAIALIRNRPVSQQQALGSDDDDDLQLGDTLVAPDLPPDQQLLEGERARALEEAFQALSPEEQIAWGTQHGYGPYEQLASIDEVVARFGLKASTISRLRRTSRQRLQASLEAAGFRS